MNYLNKSALLLLCLVFILTKKRAAVATHRKVSTKVKTDKGGKWMLHFPKFKAGGPYAVKISESGKPDFAIKLTRILVGELRFNGREMQKNLMPALKPGPWAGGNKIAVKTTQNQLAKHETYQIKK